jgi:protein-tyrosine phosphatase
MYILLKNSIFIFMELEQKIHYINGGKVMPGYFDIHCHIIPGVDDGARDMDETRRMLLTSYEEGIRIITATPHYVAGRSNIPVNKLKAIFEEVKLVAEESAAGIQIILGNELFYNLGLIDALKKGYALTIDDTRYILVEFLQSASYHEIRVGLNHCTFAGYIPILAHVERYQCLIKDSILVGELIKLGAYIQLNYSSVIGTIIDPKVMFCHKLLKNEWVHFLGTDAHGSNERVPRARAAVRFLRKKYGEDTVRQLLWDNPLTMIEDKHLK